MQKLSGSGQFPCFGFFLICLLSLSCNAHHLHQQNTKKTDHRNQHCKSKSFNEGNAAAIAIHFAEDGLLMAQGKPAQRGKAAVGSYYQSIFDEYITRSESHYEEVEVSGNLAYGRGFTKVRLFP